MLEKKTERIIKKNRSSLKKLVAVVLSICMFLTTMPTNTFANEISTDVHGDEVVEVDNGVTDEDELVIDTSSPTPNIDEPILDATEAPTIEPTVEPTIEPTDEIVTETLICECTELCTSIDAINPDCPLCSKENADLANCQPITRNLLAQPRSVTSVRDAYGFASALNAIEPDSARDTSNNTVVLFKDVANCNIEINNYGPPITLNLGEFTITGSPQVGSSHSDEYAMPGIKLLAGTLKVTGNGGSIVGGVSNSYTSSSYDKEKNHGIYVDQGTLELSGNITIQSGYSTSNGSSMGNGIYINSTDALKINVAEGDVVNIIGGEFVGSFSNYTSGNGLYGTLDYQASSGTINIKGGAGKSDSSGAGMVIPSQNSEKNKVIIGGTSSAELNIEGGASARTAGHGILITDKATIAASSIVEANIKGGAITGSYGTPSNGIQIGTSYNSSSNQYVILTGIMKIDGGETTPVSTSSNSNGKAIKGYFKIGEGFTVIAGKNQNYTETISPDSSGLYYGDIQDLKYIKVAPPANQKLVRDLNLMQEQTAQLETNGTVTLLKDITCTDIVSIIGDLTFDLNGNNIIGAPGKNGINIAETAKVTLIGNGGSITGVDNNQKLGHGINGPVTIDGTGNITIKGSDNVSENDECYGINGDVTINSTGTTTIIGKYTGIGKTIYDQYGSGVSVGPSNLLITTGTVKISGEKLGVFATTEIRGGLVTIDSSLTAIKNSAYEVKPLKISGGEVTLVSKFGYAIDCNLEMSGGILRATGQQSALTYGSITLIKGSNLLAKIGDNADNLEISGRGITNSDNMEAIVGKKHLFIELSPAGKLASKLNEIAPASVKVNQDNTGIQLLKDLSLNETLLLSDTKGLKWGTSLIEPNLTIDLNGKKLTHVNGDTVLSVEQIAEVKILDSTTTGELSSSTNNVNTIVNKGNLTINGGNLTNFGTGGSTIDNEGSLLVEGGTISKTNEEAAIANSGTLKISGGNIKSISGSATNLLGTNVYKSTLAEDVSGIPTITNYNLAKSKPIDNNWYIWLPLGKALAAYNSKDYITYVNELDTAIFLEYVGVTDITGIPTTLEVGANLILTSIVSPDNASNKTIVWTVNDQGTTNATIEDGILKVPNTGTVKVTATIVDGLTTIKNYTKEFTITVSEKVLTDTDKVAEALASINAALANLTVTNDTTKQDILDVALGATKHGVSVAWDITNDFNKVVATYDNQGSITGKLKLTLNTTSDSITINKPIAKLIYIPVTDITSVPTTVEATRELVLTGIVAPEDAIEKTIVWTVSDAGTTGATITDGNKLTAPTVGTVKILATITNGLSTSTNYTKEFTITVSEKVLTDDEKVAEVKAAITVVLDELTATNDTTAQGILDVALGATKHGVSVVWDITNDFNKVEATYDNAGLLRVH